MISLNQIKVENIFSYINGYGSSVIEVSTNDFIDTVFKLVPGTTFEEARDLIYEFLESKKLRLTNKYNLELIKST